jgi:sugar/nucleoside kinase (ribokinase family)
MGAKVVGLKAGQRGLYLRTGTVEQLEHMGRAQPTHPLTWAERELWAPCFATQVVGTTGAGDATIAGFLLGLMRGMTPVATLSAACAVGACSVEAVDAVSGIKSWPATLERIAAGWPRLLLKSKHKKSPLDMAYAGWQWHEHLEVWSGPADSSYAIKKDR